MFCAPAPPRWESIGKASAPALPVLRELVKTRPLVRRSAERAIEQIESAPK